MVQMKRILPELNLACILLGEISLDFVIIDNYIFKLRFLNLHTLWLT